MIEQVLRFAFLSALILYDNQQSVDKADNADVCSIHLRAIDERLREHKYNVVAFINSEGKDVSYKFKESVANVPCGKYTYILEPSQAPRQAQRLRGEISVQGSRFVLEATVPRNELVSDDGALLMLDETKPSGPYVKGVVRSAYGTQARWAVIRRLSDYKRAVAAVSSEGLFEFSTYLDGVCLFSIEGSSGLLHYEILDIRNAANRQPLVIELNSESRPVRIVR